MGHISIYVYNKKAPVREYVDDYIRNKTATTTFCNINLCKKKVPVLNNTDLLMLKRKQMSQTPQTEQIKT